MIYQFVLSVWGTRHLNLLSTVVMPSLMTTGNLLGFERYNSELDIYTTLESKPAVTSMPILSALAEFINIRVTVVSGDDSSDEFKYSRMNYAHGLATRRSAEIDSVLLFLSPDVVFADGTLSNARKLVENGKRAVLVAGARCAASPLLAELKAHFEPKKSFGLQISPRQLVRLFIHHPHECSRWMVWAGRPLMVSSFIFLFPVGDEGFISRQFRYLPIAVYPKQRKHVAKDTIDGRWLVDAVPDRNDWHLITDTDDGFHVDVGTPPEFCAESIDDEYPEQFIAQYIATDADEGHRWMVKQNVYVHSAERSHRWAKAEMHANETFDRVFDLHEELNRSIARLGVECERSGRGPLALYGAGCLAEIFLREIGAATGKIAAIFDSDVRKHGKTIGSLVVRPPLDIAAVESDAMIILAREPGAELEIRRTIEAANYSGRVICWRDVWRCAS